MEEQEQKQGGLLDFSGIQVRGGVGLVLSVDYGSRETYSNSQYVLKVRPIGFVDRSIPFEIQQAIYYLGNVKINLTKTCGRKAGSPGHSEQRCAISIYYGTHLIISHLEAYHSNGQKSPQKQKN